MEHDKDIRKFERFFRDPRIGDDVIKPTVSGIACENIRIALRLLDYRIVEEDQYERNQYDGKLAKIVLRFQTDNQHSSRDGFFGPGTRRLLIQKLIERYGTNIFSRAMEKEIRLLFLTADPSDLSQLRSGKEAREIQEKMQLAKLRERFKLHQRMFVQPADISQALLDVQPQIVHFSGHGTTAGALCFVNQLGKVHPVQPTALAALFEQFAHIVDCVVLNACYSEIQANAITRHIDYVVGMNQAISDEAAIAFSIGFYQTLGAGGTIKEAYKLGCVQMELLNIPEHLTPVLVEKK